MILWIMGVAIGICTAVVIAVIQEIQNQRASTRSLKAIAKIVEQATGQQVDLGCIPEVESRRIRLSTAKGLGYILKGCWGSAIAVFRKTLSSKTRPESTKPLRNLLDMSTAGRIEQLLCGFGVSPILFLHYRNFGVIVGRLARRYGGENLRSEASAAVAQWSRKELKPEVLSAICEEVFDLALPRIDQRRHP